VVDNRKRDSSRNGLKVNIGERGNEHETAVRTEDEKGTGAFDDQTFLVHGGGKRKDRDQENNGGDKRRRRWPKCLPSEGS